MIRRPPRPNLTDTLFPYTTLFLSSVRRRPEPGLLVAVRRPPPPLRGGHGAFSGRRGGRAMPRYSKRSARQAVAERKQESRVNLYDEVTARIVTELEAGRLRSEERRVGRECVSRCGSRGSTDH